MKLLVAISPSGEYHLFISSSKMDPESSYGHPEGDNNSINAREEVWDTRLQSSSSKSPSGDDESQYLLVYFTVSETPQKGAH